MGVKKEAGGGVVGAAIGAYTGGQLAVHAPSEEPLQLFFGVFSAVEVVEHLVDRESPINNFYSLLVCLLM
mgnify:CR=1 FL=1